MQQFHKRCQFLSVCQSVSSLLYVRQRPHSDSSSSSSGERRSVPELQIRSDSKGFSFMSEWVDQCQTDEMNGGLCRSRNIVIEMFRGKLEGTDDALWIHWVKYTVHQFFLQIPFSIWTVWICFQFLILISFRGTSSFKWKRKCASQGHHMYLVCYVYLYFAMHIWDSLCYLTKKVCKVKKNCYWTAFRTVIIFSLYSTMCTFLSKNTKYILQHYTGCHLAAIAADSVQASVICFL